MADISIKEFRADGYLQEVNRQFFHPLGLALYITVDDETGEEALGGIIDSRDDPEGIVFSSIDKDHMDYVEWSRRSKLHYRKYGAHRNVMDDKGIQIFDLVGEVLLR